MAASSSSCQEATKLGHRIFLSHNRADREFVRLLANRLKYLWYIPFFDEQSLPEEEVVTFQSISTKVQDCKLAVLVLSEEFFSINKNPMMEVIALVERCVHLVPLFYKLTLSQVKDKENIATWRAKWEGWNAQSDGSSLAISTWDKAMKMIPDYNGFEYTKHFVHCSAYVEHVAKSVCDILAPISLRDVRHVVGKERLVKEVEGMFDICPVVEGGVRTLGLHGIEGMGKSTLCQALCNAFLNEFEDRVCYVELHERSRSARIKTVLLQLSKANNEDIEEHTTDEGKAMSFLRNHLPKEKFFLVVDNIQAYESDRDEVRRLVLDNLNVFPRGSKILLLARSRSILRQLLSTPCIHTFPGLNCDEAKIVLQKENPHLFPEEGMDDSQQIFMNQCIELCTAKKGSGVYNPLMLKSLVFFLIQNLSANGYINLQEGCSVRHLVKLKRKLAALEGDCSQVMEVFFKKLRTSFDSLEKEHGELFLDIALYTPGEDALSKQRQLMSDRATLKNSLQKLRDISFLLEENGMLDVHKEFAKAVARQSTVFIYEERRELRRSDLRDMVKDCPKRVAFLKCTFPMAKDDLDLSSCNDLRVLLLDDNKGLKSVILGPGPNCLRILEIRSVTAPLLVTGAAVHGIETSLFSQWIPLPGFRCLTILELGGMESAMWNLGAAHCDSLEIFRLHNIDILSSTLELSGLSSLKELKLSQLPNLEVLSGLEHLSVLRKLHLFRLNALTSLAGIKSLGKLKAFAIASCERLSELKLPASLKHCSIEECNELRKIDVVSAHDHVRGEEEQNENDLYRFDEAESSDDDDCSENRLLVNDCGNLQEMNGAGLKFWKIVCANSGLCGCDANPPSFHLLSNVERIEYHCSRVVDLSTLELCSRLRSLHLDGCINVGIWPDFSKLLSLSEVHPPLGMMV